MFSSFNSQEITLITCELNDMLFYQILRIYLFLFSFILTFIASQLIFLVIQVENETENITAPIIVNQSYCMNISLIIIIMKPINIKTIYANFCFLSKIGIIFCLSLDKYNKKLDSKIVTINDESKKTIEHPHDTKKNNVYFINLIFPPLSSRHIYQDYMYSLVANLLSTTY